MVKACCAPCKRPVGRLVLALAMAFCTSSMPMIVRRELVRIHLHAHRVFLFAEHLHARDAAHHGDALREQVSA